MVGVNVQHSRHSAQRILITTLPLQTKPSQPPRCPRQDMCFLPVQRTPMPTANLNAMPRHLSKSQTHMPASTPRRAAAVGVPNRRAVCAALLGGGGRPMRRRRALLLRPRGAACCPAGLGPAARRSARQPPQPPHRRADKEHLGARGAQVPAASSLRLSPQHPVLAPLLSPPVADTALFPFIVMPQLSRPLQIHAGHMWLVDW